MSRIDEELAAAAKQETSDRVTLLAGGDTVYLYAPGNPNIDTMHAVLDVAYPGSDVERRTVSAEVWEAARVKLVAEGIEIVDTRTYGEET